MTSTTTAAPHTASPEADSPASASSPPAASAPIASTASSWFRRSTRSRRCRTPARAGREIGGRRLRGGGRGGGDRGRGDLSLHRTSVGAKHRPGIRPNPEPPIRGIPGWMPPLAGLLWKAMSVQAGATGRVLLVEDELSIAEPFAQALGRSGFETTIAPTAGEALQLARDDRSRRRAARSHAPRRRRSRRVPRAAPHLHGPDHHADGPRNRDRPDRRDSSSAPMTTSSSRSRPGR